MITRLKVQKALKRVPSTQAAATLAHYVTDKSTDHWTNDVNEIVLGWAKSRHNANRAFRKMIRKFEISEAEYRHAQDRLMIERSMKSGGEPFYFDSFDVISATLVSWLIVRKQEYGECQPEALYLMYIFKR